MGPNLTAAILGIGGLVATIVIGALGLYFTARARSASLRETLFIRQLDAIVELVRLVDRVRMLVAIALGDDPDHREHAHSDLLKCMPELRKLKSLATAILPTEMFIEVSNLSSTLSKFIQTLDRGNPDPKLQQTLAEMSMRLALMGRQVLGVDELSEESLRLFAKKDALEQLSKVTADDVRRAPPMELQK